MKRMASLIAGLVLGGILFGGSIAYAVETTAERSRHVVYLDGRAVELEAYTIDGSNYVKLRDVGQLLNFNVYWDGAVQICSADPYTGEAPVAEPASSAGAYDWSREASTGIFDTVYTRDAYNTFRQTINDADRILSGAEYAYRTSVLSANSGAAMRDAAAAIGSWPGYSVQTDLDGSTRVTVKYSGSYQEAATYCKAAMQRLGAMDAASKVQELAYFVCDRLTYIADAAASPRTALVSEAVSAGNCMSYAHCFKFLCDLAGIPCIMVHSDSHQWNQVYVNGSWWNVDVSAMDAGDSLSVRGHQQILYSDSDLQNSIYTQSQPSLTAFAKELLVPGSTA